MQTAAVLFVPFVAGKAVLSLSKHFASYLFLSIFDGAL